MTPKQLKKLQNQWYKKLKTQGFEDIEYDSQHLKSYALSWSSVEPEVFKANQRYYELAGQLLESHPFESIKDKTIWRYHTQGLTEREIGRRVGLSQPSVEYILNKLRKYITTNE